jgi:membrane associated rhomboid family serine protease
MSIIRRPFAYRFFHAVYYIIGLNLLAFLAQKFVADATLYLALVPQLALRGYPPLNFPWLWQFVTYMFAHGGWRHILFNMLGLFIFGVQVERRMGSKEFILYYLLTGTLAGILSFAVYLATGSGAILLGASGALFAVELAFAALYPDAVVYIWGIIPLRAPVMVLGYTALELVFSVTGIQSGVAHFTHLFGFAAGWLYFVVRFGINPWNAFRGRR